MRLSRFIMTRMEEILEAWESFARGLTPTTGGMDVRELRDYAQQMLEAIANDIEPPQTPDEQFQKSKGSAPLPPDGAPQSPASLHGAERHGSRYSIVQLAAEFRALRATVLRLWLPEVDKANDVVTDIVRFNEAIDQALAESIASFSGRTERARSLFIAMLGHDLRGPLASIGTAGQLLANPSLSREQTEETGRRVSRAALLMSNMVDDLADYTQASLGDGLPLDFQQVDLREIVDLAVEEAASMQRATIFNVVTDGDLKGKFDGPRVCRLLTNLLANAAKHGDPGAPVSLQAIQDGELVTIAVRNEGTPIPSDALQAIFEPMVRLQGNEGERRTRPGMGLGLHIARLVAEGHNGSIEVASGEGMDTVFTVRLPRHGR